MRIAALVLTWLAVTAAAQAKETVTVGKFTPFAENSGVSSNVKSECKMEERLPDYLRSYAKKHTTVVLTTEPLESVDGKVLYLEFVDVFALGGGAYSGSKSTMVRGELKEGGEVIASVTARRRSMAAWGFGTCSLMKKITKSLGKDIAGWLENPTMDARIGNISQ